jgi:hypothetical protein
MKLKYREFIEENTTECDISYRGGVLKIDVSSLFPELEEAIMGASQGYLGGGIAGAISRGRMFDIELLTAKNKKVYAVLAEEVKKYFYELNNGGGDDYMQENVNTYEQNQRLATRAY